MDHLILLKISKTFGLEWASNNKVSVQMFEAIDEPWKSNKNSADRNSFSGPNGGEGHYGWWYRVDTSNGPKYFEK
jgi:hypothetical protein